MTTAVEARIPADGTAAAGRRARRGGPRRRLFAKYAAALVGLVSLVLLINGSLDVWFSYDEARDAAIRLQREKADAAAQRIEEFVAEIERQIGWTTATQWAASPIEQRRFDFGRLQRQVPAITELIQLDGQGREQLKVSRLSMDVAGGGADYSADPRFTEALAKKVWFGPVYFRKESEPYMTMAVAQSGRNAGVTVAEVNLKLIWDVITAIKIGKTGYAYVVDDKGRLIAHPDISRVLRNTDLSGLPQVAAARGTSAGAAEPAEIVRNLDGHRVLSASAAIPRLGWLVFVEQPLSEALAPLYTSVLDTGLLLVLGLVVAVLAGLFLARRMTGPIRTLDAGAARIGAGALDHRITVHTGDELEALADRFNTMAADLQSSYADLEKKVEDRTAELKEALDQQTATAEVLGVINSSPGDLAPVFDAIMEKAHSLCGSTHGGLMTYDGEHFRLVAAHAMPARFAELLRQPFRPLGVQERLLRGERFVHIPDVAAHPRDTDDAIPRASDEAGIRTLLMVPLRKDDALLGYITAHREEVRPFSDKQIALLQNFAAQAVIAMENARLLTETREALEQQTATAEVLQVINSSPGDLAPVFDAILENAHGLCRIALGALELHENGKFRAVAVRGVSGPLAELLRQPFEPPPGSPLARLIAGEQVVQITDMSVLARLRPDDPRAQAGAQYGLHTALFVPLRKDAELLGQIVAFRQEERPFSEKEIALLQNFAAQAVIAMENARLLTEQREALERQAATAEVLGIIASSPGRLEPVFEAMLANAVRLCAGTFGTLALYDEDGYRGVAAYGAPSSFPDTLSRFRHAVPGTTLDGLEVTLRTVQVADCTAEPAYDPVRAANPAYARVRSHLCAPLIKDNRLLGAILIYRDRVLPFDDKQIDLVENFAKQAVIAIENARLITETREALEQQTATAEVLQVINSSPGDLAPVFDAMLDKAMALCGIAHGSLQIREGQQFRAVAVRGLPEPIADRLRQGFRPSPKHPMWPLLEGANFVHIADLTQDDRSEEVRIAVELGSRTLLFIPLRKDGALLGQIVAVRQEVRPFSDKQIALLQNFAAQAVIAMENARLITETREALEQQTATAEVLQVINSSPGDLAPVFAAMVERAARLCEADEAALRTFDGELLHLVAVHGSESDVVARLRQLGPTRAFGLYEPFARGERVVQIADVRKTDVFRDNPVVRERLELRGIRTWLAVALHKEGVLRGVINVHRHTVRPFSDKQIALLQNFAAQAVIAMENARLITETREALDQQTATAEVLGVINSSPGDLVPVFEAMLDKALGLCEASFGWFWTYEGDHFQVTALRGAPSALVEFLRQRVQGFHAGTGVERLLHGERVTIHPDMAAEEAYKAGDPLRCALVDLGGARSAVTMALRRDERSLDAFTVYRQEVRPFTDKQIALLQNFAAQAVIAMENARLITETREALEQQTATAEVLQVINSSPGDLAPVFDAMLDKAIRLCEAAFGSLWTYDGEHFHAVAVHNVPPALAEFVRQPHAAGPNTPLGRVVRTKKLVAIADLATDEIYRSGDRWTAAPVELGGARSYLAIPLLKDDALTGAFAVSRREVRPFTDKQIALLQNFAAQAVIAMENARLLTETREALEQQTATAEVLQVINSSPGDLAPVFDAMLEKAMRLCEAAFGTLWTIEADRFRPVAHRGVPARYAEHLDAAAVGPAVTLPRTSLAGRAFHGESFAQVVDLSDEELYRAGDPDRRALVDLGGARTGLAIPLRKDKAVVGVILIYRQEIRPFSDKQIALLRNFAAQAVIAMENARLLTETREALEQQTATSEVLQVINSSPGDLAPVFDAMLDKAMRLCEAAFGILWNFDGERFRATALHGVPAKFAKWLRGPVELADSAALAEVTRGNRYVHVADLADTEAYRARSPLRRAIVDLGGARTLVLVPLSHDERVIGAFAIYRQEVRPFTDRQIALLQNFAAQAVIAMENARLLNDLQQRTRDLQESLEYQTATSDVLKVISRSTFDLQPVLDTVLATAARLCNADIAGLARRDGEVYRVVAGYALPPDYDAFLRSQTLLPGRGTMAGRTALEGRVVHIADIAADPDYAMPESTSLGKIRTSLGVPLLREHEPIGVMWLARQRVEPFSERQIELVSTFADQAVIAIENTRLLNDLQGRTRDLQESLEYQTATSDVLKVISRSTYDLQPVLETVAQTAARLCESEMAFILRRDGEVYRAAAALGWSPEFKAFLESHPIVPSRGTLTGRVVLEGRAIQIADTASDPEYTLSESRTLGHARTQLGVPLMREGSPIGVIILSRQRVEPFSVKQIDLVTTFADQAVIAIENARLLNDLQGRTRDLQESLEYQTATSDVLKVISRSTFDLQPVLQTVLDTAMRLCGNSQGEIFRLEDGAYRMAVGYGMEPDYHDIEARLAIPPGPDTLVGRTALAGRPVQIIDALADPDYAPKDDARIGRLRSVLGVPLLREGVPIGVICTARTTVEPFTDKQIELVSTFADQAVIAIENARLFNELRERTAELGRSVEELKMLSEVGQAVSSTLDLRAVLSTILTSSLGLTWANAGAIFRYSRPERAFRLVEAVGWDEALRHSVGDLRLAESETAMGEAVARRMPIQLADTAQRASNPLRDLTLAAGFHSALIVPLVGPERILGAILLMRQEAGEFPPETVRLMQTLASQSVLAIQNARLFREIADKSEQLALASEHKSQFLANMSHELRTPLNAILGYAELLVDGIYGVLPERPSGVLERIQNNGRHLLALINDVLDLAKIEAGQLTLTLEDYSLPEVVRSVVTATEPLATGKGLKFTAALQEDMPKGHGDARRLSQVLLNLVGNAIKFTDAGEVEIRAAAANGQFTLTVRDTGPGIADADQERIFGEFQQIDNSNTRQKGGTGLGLAIAKRMVEIQGGTISVESALGAGSTFRVVLPVHVDEMMEAAE